MRVLGLSTLYFRIAIIVLNKSRDKLIPWGCMILVRKNISLEVLLQQNNSIGLGKFYSGN